MLAARWSRSLRPAARERRRRRPFGRARRHARRGRRGRRRAGAASSPASWWPPAPTCVAAVEQGFAAGIRRVGELWEEGEYFLPELVQGAEAMKAAMARAAAGARRGARRRPALARGRVVLGTVQGDLHDIGKGLVGVLLAAHGFEVHDLGHDVPVERFLAKAREVDADIVAASALLTTTMPEQRRLAEAIAAADLPRAPRVLVGGAPTSSGAGRRRSARPTPRTRCVRSPAAEALLR